MPKIILLGGVCLVMVIIVFRFCTLYLIISVYYPQDWTSDGKARAHQKINPRTSIAPHANIRPIGVEPSEAASKKH